MTKHSSWLVHLLGDGDDQTAWFNNLRLEILGLLVLKLLLVAVVCVAAYYHVLIWHDAGFIMGAGILVAETTRRLRHLNRKKAV